MAEDMQLASVIKYYTECLRDSRTEAAAKFFISQLNCIENNKQDVTIDVNSQVAGIE